MVVRTGEADCLFNTLTAPNQMARTTTALIQRRDIISTQSKAWVDIAQFNLTIRRQWDSVASYEAKRDDLKSNSSAVISDSNRRSQFFDDVRTKVFDFQERLIGKTRLLDLSLKTRVRPLGRLSGAR